MKNVWFTVRHLISGIYIVRYYSPICKEANKHQGGIFRLLFPHSN